MWLWKDSCCEHMLIWGNAWRSPYLHCSSLDSPLRTSQLNPSKLLSIYTISRDCEKDSDDASWHA